MTRPDFLTRGLMGEIRLTGIASTCTFGSEDQALLPDIPTILTGKRA
jgi:hypothetical protein